ncbi:MAG TPA: DUF5615 family PIN-like protein [Thermoanaerobaculia bacterium]|nr:DUF5615 family PIN-like protein [Thermoanaerobaculia bacterium]
MRAKLDENLGRSCAALLAASGHDISTVPEQGMSSWVDEQVLGACHREGRTLITLDLDFSNPLRFPPDGTPGIVVLRLPSPVTLGKLKAAIEALDAALASRTVAGKLWIVQPGAVREYEGQRG